VGTRGPLPMTEAVIGVGLAARPVLPQSGHRRRPMRGLARADSLPLPAPIGALVSLLTDHGRPGMEIVALYPQRRQLSAEAWLSLDIFGRSVYRGRAVARCRTGSVAPERSFGARLPLPRRF
jgi:hypothetical protein